MVSTTVLVKTVKREFPALTGLQPQLTGHNDHRHYTERRDSAMGQEKQTAFLNHINPNNILKSIFLLKTFRDLPQAFHYLKFGHARFLLFYSQFIIV
jgi:flagellar motor switch protein FliG